MEKIELSEFLNKLNYKSSIKKDRVIINLGLGLVCEVKKDTKDSFVVYGRLKGWNFLTGLFSVRVEMLMVYVSFWLLFITLLYYLYGLPDFIPEFIILLILGLTILWSVFYLIRFYTFKLYWKAGY
ncbi:hypothetical protein [Ascidiimonas aurantiaca]|uniref:hypothetical protein n=1 Tax=Ascidiimonas aurantiaca TaxID=1685432 RepID=UPI0030EE6229